MRVEVGDWVRFRGGKRIYEVQGTIPAQGKGDAHFLNVVGSRVLQRASKVEEVAPKFWIKKGEP